MSERIEQIITNIEQSFNQFNTSVELLKKAEELTTSSTNTTSKLINEFETTISKIEKIIKTDFANEYNKAKQLLNSFNEINVKHLTEQDIQSTKNIESLNNFSETTKAHLIEQDNQNVKNIALLESKINSLTEQNILTQKGLKVNRIIAIIGLTIIGAILIYVALKKNH